ncbi:26S proteasome non-ATPase regulatory subunit 4 [Vanrija pseudolonga]|uniref:26S proteasome non-ATPase regulatory subunit 4 n=1 Tax=Vanrija pseudolonga TaxID=143232 RepID=A0AAF1BIE3_9TREE|nr:26S proteasome non-ATPase regulatory subunit 4 [Vanrija pseudolonga]
MPLESCMLVLDNSEYMRNGDYTPTRFLAQSQAVSTVFSAKTDSNPESAVGLMTMAGKSPSLLVTPTNDIGKLLSALNKATIGGVSDLITSIQVAQLALKHRENKNQRQRVVVFVGSPIDDTKEELVKLGKRLRKNNVLIDIVTFGDEGMANDEKLGALVEAAGDGESHLVSVPPGPHLLSDVIQQSPILFDPERAGASGSGGGGGGDLGVDDFDPSSDPELAMALRMSLQEEQERQARGRGEAPAVSSNTAVDVGAIPQDIAAPANPEAGHAAGFTEAITAPLSNANDPTVAEAAGDDDEYLDEDDEEEALLARAMALSRGDNPDDHDILMAEDEEDEDEEAAIARAIAMSLEDSQKEDKDKK